MTKLTKRQQEILALIESHMTASGSPPTRAEIAKAMGFRSPNAAEDHLRALARKGVIELVPGTSRGIRLARRASGIPLISSHQLQPNQPLFSEHQIEASFPLLDRNFFNPSVDYMLHFTLKAIPELSIQEGDFLAIHQTFEIHPGQIYVARLHQEIIVRRLTSEHPKQGIVEGLVVGVIRSLAHPSRSL